MAVPLEQIQLEKRFLISWQEKELKGTVKYFGLQNQREVVGLDLDEAYGDSDGSLDGKRYFDCPEFHGLFVPPASLLSVEVEKLNEEIHIDGEHLYFSEVEKFIEMPRCPRNKISQIELVLSDADKNHSLRRKLVEQIKFCRFRSEVRFRLDINCNEETASEIVTACAVNRYIVGLEVDHTWTSKVEQSLQIWPHLRELSLVNMTGQKADEATLQKIAESLLQAKNLQDLQVFTPPSFDSAKVSDSTIAALAKLRFHFPTIRMNTGRQQSLLDCRVAVRAIRNEEAQKRVVSQQFNLVDSYKKGDLVNVMTIFRDLKDIAQQEQHRLLHLLSLLHDKHCNIGGYEFLREIPGDFDTYSGPTALGQAIPDALLAMSSESQVKYVLAEAHYQRGTLEELCKKVTAALDRVGPEMQAEDLKSFMEEEGLLEVVCHKRVLKLEGTRVLQDMRFKQSNYFYDGFPVFCCKNLFLYRHPQGAWALAGEVGSSVPLGLLRDESMAQKPRLLPLYEMGDIEQWRWPGASKLWWAECDECHFFFKEVATEETYLVDELQKFLEMRRKDPSLKRLASLDEVKLYDLKIGPMKDFARAQQKAAKWLLDVNRCTFVTDSPLVLVLIYYLIESKTKSMNGEISRRSNHIISKDGLIKDPKKPPCVHLNLQIPQKGWSFEVMITLLDFATAKEVLHKYYEITRCSSPLDLMAPIF